MIVFERLILLMIILASVFLIGVPLFQIFRMFFAKKRDSLEEARVRLEVAKKDAEAARLNKEAEELYNSMYEDALNDSETEQRKKL
jgi:biopolymer transport protein ExbB/TolQ